MRSARRPVVVSILGAAALAAGVLAAHGQPPGTGQPGQARPRAAEQAAPAPARPVGDAERPQAPPPEIKEKTSVTKHTVRIGGQPVAYTATAGTLVLRDEAEKPIASFFYVFYTRDDVADLGSRPMVYSFNGGPGTASLWMHMGFTGPRRVVYDADGFMVQPPFRLQDNEHSILDAADIVYIDPAGTGFSRMAPGQDPHRFHGVMEDIEAMADFIRVFTTRHGRWKSPKFLIGESYGTTRASGLVDYLQDRHQMYMNGVILVSMTTLGLERGVDVGYATALPYMTATAWYHKRLPPDLQSKALKEVLAESERLAMTEYHVALARGGLLPKAEREAMAAKVARLTGLSPEFVLRSNLRVEKQRFWKELLRDRGLTVGRLDSRYTGIDRDASGEAPEGDPAIWSWDGPFAAALQTYLRDELKWETDDKYYVWGDVRPWRSDPQVRVGELLRQAMTRNPFLRVFVLEGYYDGATDYFGAQYTISHIDPGGGLSDRFQFGFYESGHMMYLANAALVQAKQDLVAFIRRAAPAR
ncbi:MAG: peptidase serine carboxypeptidase [Acidobacteria bacterium]|nr:peptidase serine carboxypeptidase [Acidobacteriota bacterium]